MPNNNDYRTDEEKRYYGSDLNKYLSELTKEMTVINLDTVQYKRSMNTLRIIESKHGNEKTGYGQKEVLDILADLFRWILSCPFIPDRKIKQMGVYIVCGDYPFDKVIVKDLVEKRDYELTKDEFVQWAQFRRPLT